MHTDSEMRSNIRGEENAHKKTLKIIFAWGFSQMHIPVSIEKNSALWNCETIEFDRIGSFEEILSTMGFENRYRQERESTVKNQSGS